MNKADQLNKVTRINDSTLAVEGDIQVDEALAIRKQGEALLAGLTSPVTVDLAKAANVGSVGISILLCWMRKAEALGKRLNIINIPDKMYDVSRVSGLDEILRKR